MSNIIRRSHGFQLDHIGLGVSDTQEGVKWVEEQTGAKVDLHDPEPGQFYWSGSLAIGDSSFLEIIGPNPNYKKFHPFAALV
ncbi:MAG: VOC family protein, partial [Pseudomonadota bacterium]